MAAILFAADDSMSARSACRAAGIKESARDQVAHLAAKVKRAIQEAAADLAMDPRDGTHGVLNSQHSCVRSHVLSFRSVPALTAHCDSC